MSASPEKPTGKRILELAATRLGEQYILGAHAPKDDADWHGPWDCAEFASWCLYQTAGILYGCTDNRAVPAKADAYTGAWARDAERLGRKIDLAQAARIPGAFILRAPAPRIGHIAISDGRGGTVEAMGSRYGVKRGVITGRRWDTGVLVPGVEYETTGNEPVLTPPIATVYYLTSPFMRSETVRIIQQKLAEFGFDVGPDDGIYGPRTAAAVYAFQIAKGLVVDGEAGPTTMAALGLP